MAAMLSTCPVMKMQAQDLTSDLDLTGQELASLLELAVDVKRTPSRFAKALTGRYISLLFEKPSLRTRLTFELAIKQLGGDAVVSIGPIGDREPLKDVARNLDRWTNAIVARTFKQETIDQLAYWSAVPVINALSDLYHPCQALADILTLKERFGSLRGLKLAFCGDGNNVANSLMLCCARLGLNYAIATPPGYEPKPHITAQAAEFAAVTGASIVVTHDPIEAVTGAHAIYTDVWTSMGSEAEAALRRVTFRPYQVNADLIAAAGSAPLVMHCLPAVRGEELTDEAAECSTSVIFDQAENRLHVQKALLLMLLG
jgi:ornithine carbamoyltransferase